MCRRAFWRGDEFVHSRHALRFEGLIFEEAGLDPTVVVGGRVDALGSNARFGKSDYLGSVGGG